jgi:hypothetical protein
MVVVARVVCRVVVGSGTARLLEHAQRLALQSLGHLLGVVRGSCAKRRELACERMFA